MAIGYQAAIAALRGGDCVMVTNPDPTKPGETTVHALRRSGKRIAGPTYRKLVPNLTPVADGLFGTDMAQTFTWVEDRQ